MSGPNQMTWTMLFRKRWRNACHVGI